MYPACVYVTGRRPFTKVKICRWPSLVFPPEKNKYVETQNEHFYVCITTVLYKYMKSLRSYVRDLSDNTHVRKKA